MAFVNWEERYSVGIAQMDQHHQRLFDIINSLHEAMRAGKAKEIYTGIIAELLNYTKTHFAEEEKLMEKAAYTGLAEQKAAHAQFIKKVAEFDEKAKQGKSIITIEMSQFLAEWLKNHILIIDKKYQEPLIKKGIR